MRLPVHVKNQCVLLALTPLTAAVMLAGGCSSAPSEWLASKDGSSRSTASRTTVKDYSATPAATITERPAMPGPMPIEPASPSSLATRGSQPSMTGSAAETRSGTKSGAGADRDTRLIGLYGEFVGSDPSAGSVLDGGNNLWQITAATEGACVDPDLDRTGTMIAFASTMHRRTADIYIKPVNGDTVTQLTADPADDVMPAFSPDGKTIAFASNRSGNWDIYTTTLDGRQAIQLTNDSDQELHPSWSPDGTTMVYSRFGSQSSRWEMWTVEVNNPGMRNFLGYGLFPQWCPDPAKTKILFQRAKQRGSRDYSVWTIDYVNGQAMYPTEIVSAANAALINPAWSPDGSRIVFVAVVDPDGAPATKPTQADLWMVNIDGSNRTSLTSGQFANFQPMWSNDGSVYFVSDRSGVDNIWAVQPVGSASTPMQAHHLQNGTEGNAMTSAEGSGATAPGMNP